MITFTESIYEGSIVFTTKDGKEVEYTCEDNIVKISQSEGIGSLEVRAVSNSLSFVFLPIRIEIDLSKQSLLIEALEDGHNNDTVKDVLDLWSQVLKTVSEIAESEPKNKEAVLNLVELWTKFYTLQQPLDRTYNIQTTISLTSSYMRDRLIYLRDNTEGKVPLIDLLLSQLPIS